MDAQQFDANVLAQIESIRRIGRNRLRRLFDLDDFTQEVIIRLYANRDQLRDESRLAQWAAVSARNLAVKWNQKRAPILTPTLPDVPLNGGSDIDATLQAERWQALVNALRGLDEVERDLLVSYYVDEVGYAELQQRHGLSYSAIGVRLHRAKRKLRKRLGWLVAAMVAFFRAPKQRAFGAQPMTTSRMSMVFIAGVATTITGAVIFGWAMSGTADATPVESKSQVIAVETDSLTVTEGVYDDDSGLHEHEEGRRDADDHVFDDDRPRAGTDNGGRAARSYISEIEGEIKEHGGMVDFADDEDRSAFIWEVNAAMKAGETLSPEVLNLYEKYRAQGIEARKYSDDDDGDSDRRASLPEVDSDDHPSTDDE